MFTGIIECVGRVLSVETEGSNCHFHIESAISGELRPDQSVAHDGVCLTVTDCDARSHWVTAVAETLQKTHLASWTEGRSVNLERAMKVGDRLDGHLVQGHVDATGICLQKMIRDGSHLFTFSIPDTRAALIVEKGSVCVNGVSLTAFDVQSNCFSVTIIPYTMEHTTFSQMEEQHPVNLEFDLLGKYILRQQELQSMHQNSDQKR